MTILHNYLSEMNKLKSLIKQWSVEESRESICQILADLSNFHIKLIYGWVDEVEFLELKFNILDFRSKKFEWKL